MEGVLERDKSFAHTGEATEAFLVEPDAKVSTDTGGRGDDGASEVRPSWLVEGRKRRPSGARPAEAGRPAVRRRVHRRAEGASPEQVGSSTGRGCSSLKNKKCGLQMSIRRASRSMARGLREETLETVG